MSWFSWLGWILLSLLLIAVGGWLPFMPAVQRFQEAHPSISKALIVVNLAMAILGTLLLVFSQFLVRGSDPQLEPLAQTDRAKGSVKDKGGLFTGKMISASFAEEVRFWQIREAFRNGEWWRVRRWRRVSLMLMGAILLFYGLFGLLFLLFPPGVKFILLLAVA